MKIVFYILLLFYLITSCLSGAGKNEDIDLIYLKDGQIIRGHIFEETDKSIKIEYDNRWKEIYKSEIEKIRTEKESARSNLAQTILTKVRDHLCPARVSKIIAGFCTNYIFGYDYQDKEGYGFGPGFRFGYCVDISSHVKFESSYTFSIHKSDTVGNEKIYINSLDIYCKYILISQRKIRPYLNLGLGLDLFSTKEVDIGLFSYLPQFGIGTYICINEKIDLDIGANIHPVRFDIGDDHKPDASFLQLLLLVDYKL